MAQERRAKGGVRAETIAESATHALDLNARRVAAHVARFVLTLEKRTVIFPGRATRRDGRPQRFDLVPGLGCNLAAQCVMLEFDKNGRPAGGAVAASVRNAPS